MTDGLAILGAWLELAAVLGVVAWRILRTAEDDPLRELRHSPADDHPPNG